MERRICLTGTIPCFVDATKFWQPWPHHHLIQTSFCGRHLSRVWRGENLKVLSWACRVDAVCVTASPVLTLVWGPVLSHYSNILHRFLSHRTQCKCFIFFSVLTYASELIFVPLCITSKRITPSEAQNTVTIMFLAVGEQSSCTFPSSPPVTLFCAVIYSPPTECSIAINIAKPFMDVPHHFFLCRKEPLSKHVVCDDITGRLHSEELQQRCHLSGNSANSYFKWWKFKSVLPELTAF